jgi:N-acetylmuramoyl-L-alanine amidase
VGKVVVIDPGHGGDDLGATGNGLDEAEVVLDLARRLEGRMTTSGVTAVLTRDRGQNPTDAERALLAQQVGADVFLSLHCDSGATPPAAQAEGVASFYWGGYDSTSFSGPGQRLAGLVQSEVVARTGLIDCRMHPRTWDLLRLTNMPAVRVELGYLTHPGDARRLADPAFRDTCAEALLAAVQRLFLSEPEDWTTGSLSTADVRALARLEGD